MKNIGIHLMASAFVALAVALHTPQAAAQGNAAAPGVVKSVNGLAGQVSISAGPGITITPAGNGLTIGGQPAVPTSINGFTGQVTLAAGPGITLTRSGNSLTISAGATVPENVWRSGGNQVAPGDFLGTLNDAPLEFKVNGMRALRLEPNNNGAPNLI